MAEKTQWNSPIAFILAMIGAAVGLGNIWRFSYVVYSNGGGAFFIPYLIAIAIMGIPFLILEYGMGYSFRDSFPKLLKKINPRFEFISWMLVLFVFLVVIYYVVILSWDLVYLLSSLTFQWGTDSASYFVNVVGGSSNLSDVGFLLIPTAIGILLMWGFVWFISHKELNEGIGRISKILIPALFVLMVMIVIYALTLPGASIGVNTLLNPDWSRLTDINIWLAAFSQILFSLSMGQAISYTYASYLPEGSRINDNVLLVVFANSSFEVFTAFGIFSILGFMSFTSGTPMIQLVDVGTGLIFIVFPRIFNVMGPIGHILAPLLFLTILFAGITSAVAIFEPMVNSIQSKFKLPRKNAVTALSIVGCVISLIYATGVGSYLVGVVDSFVNEFGILLLIAIQCIIFTWIYDVDSLIPIVNENSKFKVGKTWKFIIKYILPIFLLIIWIIGVYYLFLDASSFELMVDIMIMLAVLVASGMLTKIKSKR